MVGVTSISDGTCTVLQLTTLLLKAIHLSFSWNQILGIPTLCFQSKHYPQNKRRHRRCQMSDSVLSKTPFFLYLEKRDAQDLQTICCAIGCQKEPTPRWAPKEHNVANKTQETHCAKLSGTNMLVLEQTRNKFTSLFIILQVHENELE